MKVTELRIKRQESYETDAGQLKGLVTLVDPSGQQTLVLSNGSVGRIFEIIKEDVITQSKLQAKLAERAVQEAADEPLLIARAEVLELSNV